MTDVKVKIPNEIKQIFLFCVVGIVGFIVDTAVLYLLKSILGLYGARGVSFISAVFSTWLLNRSITFKERRYTHWYQEFAYYFAYMIVGGVINLTIYMLLVAMSSTIAQYPIIGVAAGSVTGMMVNYLSSKFLIFKNK